MKRTAIAVALLLAAIPASAQTLAARVTHYDVSKMSLLKAVHDGAGTMHFGPLMTDKRYRPTCSSCIAACCMPIPASASISTITAKRCS
ncbi:MAG TPA: hypothetical protein VHY57_08975 [Rhizomicrobium sp.]|nr:hypothetical protein [Rhizomicrobium sp.]